MDVCSSDIMQGLFLESHSLDPLMNVNGALPSYQLISGPCPFFLPSFFAGVQLPGRSWTRLYFVLLLIHCAILNKSLDNFPSTKWEP